MRQKIISGLSLVSISLVSLASASIVSPAVHMGEHVLSAANNTWAWKAGAASTIVNGIYKDAGGHTIVYPYVGYSGSRLTIAGPSGWYRVVGPKMLNISVGGTLLPDSFDPKKSTDKHMQQLNDREYSIGAGLQGSLLLKSLGLFNVRLLRAFRGGNGGYYGDASYTAMVSKGLGPVSVSLIPSLGVQYYSDKLANYYYGVSSTEATKSGFKAYAPGAGFQPYISIGLLGEVKGRVRAYVSTKIARLPDSVENSPIISKRYYYTTTLVLSFGL